MKFYLRTLGCPKNEVDSEGLVQVLIGAGHEPVESPEEADLLIANTCGFIEAARLESLDALRELADVKLSASERVASRGKGHKRIAREGLVSGGRKVLIAAGCLGERLGESLIEQVNGIDAVLGTRRWAEVAAVVERAEEGQTICWTGPGSGLEPQRIVRIPGSASAYVKIADGCDAGCAFCAIPSIKGGYHSRPIEAILEEVSQLASDGVKEVVLIAQDTTAYGRDLGMSEGLATLLDAIVERVPNVPWLRLMYAYPQFITSRLLDTMAKHRQILKYVDLPMQHAHPEILKRMRRPHGAPSVVVSRIREALPEVALRTTFIVGFPGETEEEFRSLLRFMEEMRFDRVGVFTFSPEEGTLAGQMEDQVPEKTKRRRFDRAMRLQQQISLDLNRSKVGQKLDVLIEGPVEGDDGSPVTELADWVGRSYRDAPEIDGLVFVKGEASVGQIVRVRVTEALEYDLVGSVVS